MKKVSLYATAVIEGISALASPTFPASPLDVKTAREYVIEYGTPKKIIDTIKKLAEKTRQSR